MYYDRTISPRLLSKLKSPEYQKLIEYVKCHDGLELHFRKTKDTSSMGTLYKGRGAILSLNTKGAFYDIKKQKEQTEGQKEPKRQYLKSEDFTKAELDKFIEESWKNGSPKAREDQYNDTENEKNEGYYQSLVGRRYSFFSRPNDDFIIFDKELEIGYESSGDKSNAKKANGKNERCDYIGLTRDGHLMLIEVKISSNWVIGSCSDQIDTYRKFLEDLLIEKKKEDVKSNILLMIEQKQKKELGLINKDWKPEAFINGNIELAIVIGDLKVVEDKTEADGIAIRRFREAKQGAETIEGIIHYYAWDKNVDLIEITNENEKLLGFMEPGQVSFREREQNRQADLLEDPELFERVSTIAPKSSPNVKYLIDCGGDNKDKWKFNLCDAARKICDYSAIQWHTWAERGDTLSSQIACVNHLLPIAKNKDAILALLQGLDKDFDGVIPLIIDKNELDENKKNIYIAFEIIDKENKLKESGRWKTKIDALVLGKKNDQPTLIIFEWKYTEEYSDFIDKSTEIKFKSGKQWYNIKGPIINYRDKQLRYSGVNRMKTYNKHINQSKILIPLSQNDEYCKNMADYVSSVYYLEPFYQLMRQTLWIEKHIGEIFKLNGETIRDSDKEVIVKDYLHVHVVPSANNELTKCKYPINEKMNYKIDYRMANGEDMEHTWKRMLNEGYKDKYIIIDPQKLFEGFDTDAYLHKKYSDLIKYLKERYW